MDGKITPIRDEEEEFLEKLGGSDHIVRYSEGFKDGDRIIVESGPLRNFSGEIIKTDRHNRQATIALSLFGRKITGIENNKKSESTSVFMTPSVPFARKVENSYEK